MTEHAKQLVIVRDGGDIATGTIHRLYRCGYPVLVLESGYPSAIRRCVAFSEVVCDDTSEVEGTICIKASGYEEACTIMEQGVVPVVIDENCAVPEKVRPWILVDAMLAKKNLGTTRDITDKTIGFGPGLTAGQDVDLVIRATRGHNLGRIVGNGSIALNIEIPGVIDGCGTERVIHASAKRILLGRALIGDTVKQGQAIGVIVAGRSEIMVEASLTRFPRGITKGGHPVVKGPEIADIDSRKSEYENCFIIPDKARRIAGFVVEGLQMLEVKQGY